MIDVLIGQAYFLRFDAKMWAAQQPYPPLGALYAAAVLREQGARVALFDAMVATSEIEWEHALDAHRPRLAVLYEDSFNYLSKMCLSRMRDAALAMVDAARRRGVEVIVAGSDASDHPELYLARGARAVVVGEGEITLAQTVRALGEGHDLENVNGLCLRGDEGRTRRTRPRALLRDLDELPRPAWDLIDVERYRSMWHAHHGYFSMNVATTRGCPYHCNWCAKPIYGQRYTVRSVDSVVDEIAWLKAAFRPDHLWIADDIFGLKPGWIERFAALVKERDARIPFKCLLRADGVTPAIATALAEAGCQTVWMGAESGSQKILDAMEKGTTIAQIESAVRALRRAGIEVGFFLQFGYPGETLQDIEMTRAMVARCRPDDIGVSVSYPLPGTPFFERVRAELGPKQNWVASDDLALMYRGAYSPQFYRALHSLVHTEFRLRRSLDELRHPSRRLWRRATWSGLLRGVSIPWRRWTVRRLSQRPVSIPVGGAIRLAPASTLIGSNGAVAGERTS
jgi:anaerobic magnesium-protoporphyrin IX monomethyl ester cyclase